MAYGHKAKLTDGTIVLYERCSEERDSYADLEKLKFIRYLGKGVIYEISGVKQKKSKDLFHFWGERKGRSKTKNGLIQK